MYKYVILFILGLGVYNGSHAQSAKELYQQAKSAYESANYEIAAAKAELAKSKLGSTNPKVESILVAAYFYSGKIVKAKIAYQTLLKVTPHSKRQSNVFTLYKNLGNQIDNALAQKEKDYQKELENEKTRRMVVAKEIERKIEKKDKKKISISKSNSAENKIYKKAKESGNLKDLKVFTKSFPDANKFEEISEKIKAIEKENYRIANEDNVWEKAKQTNTVYAFNHYLKVYYDGKYRSNAKEKIYQLNALAQYKKAKRTNQLSDYVYYYENYKRGYDFQSVKSVIQSTYLNSGNEYYKRKKWGYATNQYNNYVLVYGSSYSPSYLRKRIKRAKRLYNEDSYDFTSIHYDKYGHGMSLGSLGKDHIAWYFTIKGKTHFLFDKFDTQEVTFPIESPNFFEIESGNYGDQVWKERYTKDVTDFKKQSFVGIIGLTQKIWHPLWANVGVGFGWYNKYENVKTEFYRRSGNDYYWDEFETAYVEDPYYKNYRFTWEAGLKLVIFKKIILSYGFTNGHGEVYQYFGIGIGGVK